MQTLDSCRMNPTYVHLFVWDASDGKDRCMFCGKEKTTLHDLEDWEAKK